MAWAIDYNGVGSTTGEWTKIEILSHRSEAKYAQDGVTHETTLHELEGTALVAATDSATFNTNLATVRKALSRQSATVTGNLTIKVNGNTYVDIEGGDEVLGTPQSDFSVKEYHGQLGALVAFTLRWNDYETVAGDSETTFHVMSHWWTQQFELEESGLLSWTVSGSLRARGDVTATSTSPKLGPNPDVYRRLIVPALPAGFRWKKMNFATDETGNRLVYTLEGQEYPRKLPSPAKKGEGRFVWRRSLMSANGMLGLKVFEAELESDKDASPADLLASMVRVSQNRIAYTGVGADQILEIEVTEHDIFTRNRIGLRIVARGTGNARDPINTTPGFRLLQDITEGTEPYEPPDAHGAALVRSVQRTLFQAPSGYTEATFPIAQTEDAPGPEINTYQVPDALFSEIQGNLIAAGPEAGNVQPAHEDYPYLDVRVSERVVTDSGMIALPSQSLTGNDLPFQTRRPTVLIVTEYRVSRQGQPPSEFMLDIPAGTILVHQERAVMPGAIDADNNRAFHAVYRRVVQVMKRDQQGMWLIETGNVPGLGQIKVVRWNAPADLLAMPFDPRTQANANRDLFSPSLQNDWNFYLQPDAYITV